jgi:hypothetical protein
MTGRGWDFVVRSALVVLVALCLAACGPITANPPIDWAPPQKPIVSFNDVSSSIDWSEGSGTVRFALLRGLGSFHAFPGAECEYCGIIVKLSAQVSRNRFVVFLADFRSESDPGTPPITEEAYLGFLDLEDDGSIVLSTLDSIDYETAAIYEGRYGVRFSVGEGGDSKVLDGLVGQYSTETLRRLFSDADFVAGLTISQFVRVSPGGDSAPKIGAANAAAWRGDYETALLLGKELAAGGNGAAAYAVATLLGSGVTGTTDCPGAARYTADAERLGFTPDGVANTKAIVAAGATSILPSDPYTRCAGQPIIAAVVPPTGARRVALVIGNSQYTNVPRLPNAGNDATDVSAALERVGFEVTQVQNADYGQMRASLQRFSADADGADMAVVYYAGHGFEIDSRNYLVPVDAWLKSDRDIDFETIPLAVVENSVSGAKTLSMVILDACRDNPFAVEMALSSPTRSIGRGLSAVEPSGGVLIAYSAKGGSLAKDGTGRNSPFASAFIEYVDDPGLDVGIMFRKIGDAVMQATNNQQEPFVYGRLPGDFIYLVAPDVDVYLVPQVAPVGDDVDADAVQTFNQAVSLGALEKKAADEAAAKKAAEDAAAIKAADEATAKRAAEEAAAKKAADDAAAKRAQAEALRRAQLRRAQEDALRRALEEQSRPLDLF